MSIERNIAFRYLKAKRKRLLSLISVLAVGGVGLGVAALIVVLAVMAGFETNLKNKLLGMTAHITLYRGSENIQNWKEVIAKIEAISGVRSASPFVYGQVMVTNSGGASGVFLKGLDPASADRAGFFTPMNLSPLARENLDQPMKNPWEYEEDPTSSKNEVPQDETVEEGQTNEPMEDENTLPLLETVETEKDRPLIIGRDLALILGAQTLTPVNVISPFGRISPLGNRTPLSRVFKVAGTFQTNLYEYDSSVAYTTLSEAQSLLGMNDEVSVIEIMVEDIYQAANIREKVLETAGTGLFWARDWMEMNMSLFSALKLEQTAMFVILTLIILVAAFNIASTLIMMVTEKTRDIAILKAMGATSAQIRKIFTLQGLAVGTAGTLGGFFFGVLICLILKRYEFISLPPEIYLMNTLPVEIRPLQILAITLVSLFISYLATVYPAAQAARLDPVEALRYE